MSDKIYTIKNNNTGQTFKVQLDHKPSSSEMMSLADKEMARVNEQNESKASIRAQENQQVQSQTPNWKLNFAKGLVSPSNTLQSLKQAGLGLYDVGKGVYDTAQLGANPIGTTVDMAAKMGQGKSKLDIPSMIPIVGPIYSNIRNIVRQPGNPNVVGRNLASLAGQTALIAAPGLGKEPKPELLPAEKGLTVHPEYNYGAYNPGEPIDVSEEPKPQIAAGMGDEQTGIEGQVQRQITRGTPKQLTTRPPIKSPGEIGTPRTINLPSRIGFGSMPASPLDVQKLQLQQPNIAGELPPGQDQLQLSGGNQPQIAAKASRGRWQVSYPKRSSRIIQRQLPESTQVPAVEQAQIQTINLLINQLSKQPTNRDLIATAIGQMKNNGVSPEQIQAQMPPNVDKVAVQTELQKQFGQSMKGVEQQIGRDKTGYSERSRIGRLKQQLKHFGITFGPNDDEPPGIVLPSGLGGLQKLWETKVEAPGAIENWAGSAQKTLQRFPESKDDAELVGQIPVRMNTQINQFRQSLAKIRSQLKPSEYVPIINAIEHPELPHDPVIIAKANAIKQLEAQVRNTANNNFHQGRVPIPPLRQGHIGYVENYFSHIPAYEGPEFAGTFDKYLRSGRIVRNFVNDFKNLFQHESEPQEFYEGKLPGSRFMLHRKGGLEGIETDLPHVIDSYGKSLLTVSNLRPLYQKLDMSLRGKSMPSELQDTYRTVMKQIKSPSLDDNMLSAPLTRLARTLQSGLFTSKLAISPILQTLHFGNYLTQVLPDLGIRDTAFGLRHFLKNPKLAWDQVMKTSSPSRSIPWELRSFPSKVQNIAMLGDIGYKFSQALSIGGYLKQAVDEGFGKDDAFYHAAYKMQQAFGQRNIGSMSPAIASAYKNPIGSFFLMYRTTLLNLGENYARQIQSLIDNPGFKSEWIKTMSYIASGVAAYAFYKKTGIAITHFSWRLVKLETALDYLGPVFQQLGKGNVEKAWDDFVKFMEPSVVSKVEQHGIEGVVKDYPKQKGIPRIIRKELDIPSRRSQDYY